MKEILQAEALDVFGDPARAAQWLHAPNAVLNGRKPFEVLDSASGRQQVRTLLGRIAHGIFS